MHIWLLILILSALVGALSCYFMQGWKAFIVAAALPWFGVLSALLITEQFASYQGGEVSLWPIAQLFGGTAAAISGVASCAVVKLVHPEPG